MTPFPKYRDDPFALRKRIEAAKKEHRGHSELDRRLVFVTCNILKRGARREAMSRRSQLRHT